MTPAISLAKKLKIPHRIHQYAHDPDNLAYGLEAAEKLKIPGEQVFKTLIVSTDKRELIVAVVPVTSKLNMKMVASTVGARKAEMANQSDAERSSGYVLGGISPMGQKKKLRTIIDSSAKGFTKIFVSAGRRGLEIELSPEDLRVAVDGIFAEICQA